MWTKAGYIPTPCTTVKNGKTFAVTYNTRDAGHYGCDTTALYIRETSQFLILNGKHTFDKCSTLQEHIDYFYKHIDQANPTSEHGTIFRCNDEGAAYVPGGY